MDGVREKTVYKHSGMCINPSNLVWASNHIKFERVFFPPLHMILVLTGISQWCDTTGLYAMNFVPVMNVDGGAVSENRSETDRAWTSPAADKVHAAGSAVQGSESRVCMCIYCCSFNQSLSFSSDFGLLVSVAGCWVFNLHSIFVPQSCESQRSRGVVVAPTSFRVTRLQQQTGGVEKQWKKIKEERNPRPKHRIF